GPAPSDRARGRGAPPRGGGRDVRADRLFQVLLPDQTDVGRAGAPARRGRLQRPVRDRGDHTQAERQGADSRRCALRPRPRHGRRGVLLTTSGIALALVVWVVATAVGLSALLRTSAEVLFALKIVGACYLAYLGVRTLIESRQRPPDLLEGTPPAAPAQAVFR